MNDWRCEMGWSDSDAYGKPIVRMCGKPADLHPKRAKNNVIQIALCPEHLAQWLKDRA